MGKTYVPKNHYSCRRHQKQFKQLNVGIYGQAAAPVRTRFNLTGKVWQDECHARITQTDVISLPIFHEQHLGVLRGLERIIDREKQKGLSAQDTYSSIVASTQQVFSQPDFYDQSPFIDLMISPALRKFADSLSQTNFPLVIDCGHIDDAHQFYASDTDEITLEDGVVLLKYLQNQGRQDVRLSILFNDIHIFNAHGHYGRKFVRALERQAKQNGIHNVFKGDYSNFLLGYGLLEDQWQSRIGSIFESHLTFRSRQELAAYIAELDHPFQVDFIEDGVIVYTIPGTQEKRNVTNLRGAPNCTMISAQLDRKHELDGAKTVLYLRDEDAWGCAVRQGTRAAREMFGVSIPVFASFYTQIGNRVHAPRVDQL